MKENNYQPNPIDTTDVVVPDELNDLLEKLAKNVHETWAAGRMKEGWKHGVTRDDAKKEHPCLVAYEELPDNEKEYDRETAMQTIKVMLKLGFKISD